jgi:hypothetical protein
MILGVSNPIENSPAWVDGMENARYTKQVQCKTVLDAMLFWFTNKGKEIVWN